MARNPEIPGGPTRPTSTHNETRRTREGTAYDLYQNDRVRIFEQPARCPRCGHLNTIRQKATGVCRACVVRQQLEDQELRGNGTT